MSTTSKTTPPYSTPPRDIPDRVNSEQATENDNGSSLLLVSCSEKNNVSPFLYQSLPTSSFSASLRPRLSTAAAAVSFDNEEHHNEDAAPYLTDSPNESESHRENTTDRNGETQNQHAAVDTPEENLTTAHQVVETDSDNEKTEMVIITDDFNSKSLISTYCEIKMEAAEKKQKQQNDDDVRPRLQSVLPDINAAKSSCEQEAQIFQMDGDDLHHFEDNVDHTAAANMSSIPVNFQIDDDEIISVTDNMISSDIRTIRSGNTTRHTPPESETSDTNSDRSSADTREEVDIIIKRDKLCSSIAGCSSQTEYKSPKFTIAGIKGVCTFHAQGLDQDLEDRFGTLTALFTFPRNPASNSVLNQPHCEFKLSVYVYEGPVENNCLIGKSSACRAPTEEDKSHTHKMYMTVHRVVNLSDVIFSTLCPSKLTVKVVAEV